MQAKALSHLNKEERRAGNRRNGKVTKQVKTSDGET